MPGIRAARKWLRDTQAVGIAQLIVRAPDPVHRMRDLRDSINDQVIDAILNLSYLADKGNEPAEALTLARLGVEASLHGGTSAGQAEALTWQAIVLLSQARQAGDDGHPLLDEAARAARAALDIYEDVQSLTEIHPARRRLARIHRARGDLLAETYDDGAFAAWAEAAALHHELGMAYDEFLVRRRMFRYAVELDRTSRTVELGEACVAAASASLPTAELADTWHLLGAVYAAADQVGPAVAAYRWGIELYLSGEQDRGAAGLLLLELGLLEAGAGRYEDAYRDLSHDMPGGDWDFWVKETTLASICHMHLGDLGAAMQHADQAPHLSISGPESLTCRVYSLHQSGVMHLHAGDAETAYRRFTQLMPLMTRDPEPIVIHISPVEGHPVAPPRHVECALLAYRMCEATGRREEARTYLALHLRLAREDPGSLFPAEVAEQMADDPESRAATAALRAFESGMALKDTDPRQALSLLNRARAQMADLPGFPDLAGPQTTAHVEHAAGYCHMRLKDHAAAAAAFGRALDVCPPGTDIQLRIECLTSLATIAAGEGNYTEAYHDLARCTELMEQCRSSLTSIDERIAFLRDRLFAYQLLVTCCCALNHRTEAFDAAQHVKSRSLLDLLAQPAHRPIDYEVEAKAAIVRADREKWIAEHVTQTHADSTSELQMLESSISNQRELSAIERERADRSLFDKLQGHASPLALASVKDLLHP